MNLVFLLRKGGQALLTLFLASIVIFVAVRTLPGDPALILAGEDRSPEVIAAIRAQYGLDQPWPVQYASFVFNALQGNLGTSARSGAPVSEMIAQTLPVTLQLAGLATLFAAVFGMLSGTVAAYWKGRWPEWVSNAGSTLGLSIPPFWLGMVGILVFAVGWGVLPAGGYVPFLEDPWQFLAHMVMPAVVLGFGIAAVIARQTRSSMLEALTSEYVVAARAKGLREGAVLTHHALRNSLIVVITIIGLQLGALISGVVITERVFGLPGFGKLTVDAIAQRDYAVVQGVVLVVALLYVVINLIIDVLYSLIDPRVRVGGRG